MTKKEIFGYEGLYFICDDGRVVSLSKTENSIIDRFLVQNYDNQGYRIVRLSKKNIRKIKKVHRLVAQAFIPNPLNLPQVNHIDGNKLNNHVKNLEWCTGEYNMQHCIKMGLHPIKRGVECHKAKLNESQVLEILASADTNKNLAKTYNVTPTNIRMIREGRSWCHLSGLKWNKRKTKIDEKDAVYIYNSAIKPKYLAARYGVSIDYIYSIKRGNTNRKHTGAAIKKYLVDKNKARSNHFVTAEQVVEIFNSKENNMELGQKYGFDRKTISNIKIGKSYSKLTGKVFIPKKNIISCSK